MKSFLTFTVCVLAGAFALQAQLTLNTFPTREYGQLRLTTRSAQPNLVEGRELARPQTVVLDTSVAPPILYVSDFANSRVLGWRNATSAGPGTTADIVIGQNDLTSTVPNGPGTAFAGGLGFPTGIAVDSTGNLYVVDTLSNRILRYPKPFQQLDQKADRITPDFVIGQKDFTSSASGVTDSTISTAAGGLLQTALAFDAQGNLWFTDAGNNRVLRYPASLLASGKSNGPAADTVLGQINFTAKLSPAAQDDKTRLLQPSGLAFDAAGRLFVPDGAARVAVYVPGQGFVTGQSAARLMGIVLPTPGSSGPAPRSEQTLGSRTGSPAGVFTIGNIPYVIDTPNHRILRYDPYESWPAEVTQFSPSARASYGQTGPQDFVNGAVNNGKGEPTSSSFNSPTAGVAGSNEVYIVDSANNRLLAFPNESGQMSLAAARVVGQLDFFYNAPNLIEGRELFLTNGFAPIGGVGSFADGGGMVVDGTGPTPRFYIADSFNNRILGFKDVRSLTAGQKADLVIGQPDLQRSVVNYPNGDFSKQSATGLAGPVGLAVDKNGDLFVCDSFNGRVLRFPSPFKQTQQTPNLVIGQPNLVTRLTDASSRTLGRPFGIAFDVEGNLLVSDAIFNRILLFRRPSGGDFTTNQPADKVFGQPDFLSINAGTANNRFVSPRGIALDTSDRLYVADAGNGRVVIYDSVEVPNTEAAAALTLPNLNSPHGVYVGADTGEIWVADSLNNRVLRYSQFDTLISTPTPTDTITNLSQPVGVTLDIYGNLFVAETSNRVTQFFPPTTYRDAAAFTTRPISPGMLASLFPVKSLFTNSPPSAAGALPYPSILGDIQVTINGTIAPLLFVSGQQINLLIPSSLTIGTAAEVIVTQVSTGRILANTFLQTANFTPGFFTVTGNGTGQISALNQDNSVNSASNPIPRGQVIQMFGTGQGFVPTTAASGAAPGVAVSTPVRPRVIINGPSFVPDAAILYAGLSPQFPGVFQVNVQVPTDTPPLNNVQVVVVWTSFASNSDGFGGRISTTIAVK